MKCHQVIDRLSSWLDGELAEAERQAVDRHVETCPACRLELDRLRADRQVLVSASRPEEPPFLAARVMAEIRSTRRAPARGLLRRALVPVAAALLIAVGAGAGTLLGTGLARSGQAEANELTDNNDDLTLEVYASAIEGD